MTTPAIDSLIRPRWNAVFAMTLAVSALIIADFLPAGVLTPIATDLQITEGQAGQTVTVTSFCAMLSSLLIAYVTRRWNRKTVLLILALFLSLSCVVVAWAPDFFWLLSARVVLGFALGGFWSMSTATAMRLVPADDVPKALAIIFGGSSFSSMLAAPLGSFLGQFLGWRTLFLMSAGVGMAALVWLRAALPALPPTAEVRLRTLIDVLKKPLFLVGMGGLLFIFGARFALFTYLRPFLEHQTGLAVNGVSGTLLLFGAAYFVGNGLSAGLIRKYEHLMLRMPPVLLSLIPLSLFFWGTQPIATAVIVGIWGLMFGPVPVVWSGWMARRAPEYAETAGGLYVASIQFSAALGAISGGWIYDAPGSLGGPIGLLLLCFFSWSMAAFVVNWGLRRRKWKAVMGESPQPTT